MFSISDDALFSESKFCQVEMHDEKQHVTETQNNTFEDAESLNTQHLDTQSSQGTEVQKEVSIFILKSVFFPAYFFLFYYYIFT